MTTPPTTPPRWFRQFWPWFIIALPATVVVASIGMLIVALRNDDSTVRDDYYKEGLAINQQLASAERAQTLALRGAVALDAVTGELRVTLAGELDAWPDQLVLELNHPLDEDADFELLLRRIDGAERAAGSEGNGVYRADLDRPLHGRWHLELHPLDRSWRLRHTIAVDTDDSQRWDISA